MHLLLTGGSSQLFVLYLRRHRKPLIRYKLGGARVGVAAMKSIIFCTKEQNGALVAKENKGVQLLQSKALHTVPGCEGERGGSFGDCIRYQVVSKDQIILESG